MLLVIKRLLSKIILAALGYNTLISIIGLTLLINSGPIIYISLPEGGGGVFLGRLLLGLVFSNFLIGVIKLSLLLVYKSTNIY